jgi:hypothetical protein
MKLLLLYERLLKEQDEVSIKDICDAITNRHKVELVYSKYDKKNGTRIKDSSPRIIHPHRFHTSKQGDKELEAFQEKGQSKSEFKRFKLNQIETFNVLEINFEPNPQYNPSGNKFAAEIHCEI